MVGQILRQVALTILLAFCPVLSWSGALDRGPMQQRYNPAAESMIRVPGVIGLDERQAMSSLQQAGLTVRVEYATQEKDALAGKEFSVIDQEPDTAGVAMLGSTVTITVYKPPGAAQPDPYGRSGGGYYDDGYGGYQQQPGGYYDDYGGYQQQPGGYDDDGYGRPESQPVPWGDNPQPADGNGEAADGGTWSPSSESSPVPPSVEPNLGNDVPSVEPPVPVPAKPIVEPLPRVSSDAQGSKSRADLAPVRAEPVAPSQIQRQLDEKLPARKDIRDKMRGVKKIKPAARHTESGVQSRPIHPASMPAEQNTGIDKRATPVDRSAKSLTPLSKTVGAHKGFGAVTGKVLPEPSSSSRSNGHGQGTEGQPFIATLAGPVVSSGSPWRVGSWQTDRWETFYEEKDQPLDTWKNFQTHIRRAYGRIIDHHTSSNPIVVDTPQGKVACSSASIQDALKFIRVGLFFNCLAGLQNMNLMNVVRGVETNMKRLLAMLKRLNVEMLPEKGRSRDGTITSATHKKFISYYSKDDQINLTITKTGGKSRATVVGYIGDISNVWRPWNCEFSKGKNNIGDTCSFAFQEANNRFIGVRIDGYSAVNSFKYRISVN